MPQKQRAPGPRRRLASLAVAADDLNVSERTIRRRIADGTITAYRVGTKLIRVDLDEVEQKLLCPIQTASGGRAA